MLITMLGKPVITGVFNNEKKMVEQSKDISWTENNGILKGKNCCSGGTTQETGQFEQRC